MKSDTTDTLISTWFNTIENNTKKPLSPIFFSYTVQQNHEEACYLFRYFFEKVMDWSPWDALNYLNKDVVDTFNLRKAYSNFNWPKELKDGRFAYPYVAHMCYPDVVKDFDRTRLWIMEYNQILSGGQRKATDMFDADNDGFDKSRILLNYYMGHHPNEKFKSLEDMYQFFADDEKAKKFLKKIKLIEPCENYFDTALEYFHQSLPLNEGESSRNELLYMYSEFNERVRRLEQSIIAEKKVKQNLNIK